MSYKDNCEFYAFGEGKVIAKPNNNWANIISIKYDNLPGYRVTYLHASKLKLDVGSKVHANTLIGYQGAKGTVSSHVHYLITSPSNTLTKLSLLYFSTKHFVFLKISSSL